MADEKQILSLDLDAKGFMDSGEKALGLIQKIGDGGGMDGLISSLKTVGALAGVIGTAYLALKTSLDLTMEAEQIEAINAQFELLTKNAGISTQALSDGLKTAANGLVDDTDLLKAANKAIVEMGASAAKLPETLSLARKVTATFGGELTQNFEAINQAISSGRVIALKHMGIIVDANKAYQDYAKSIGVSASVLSEEGKQQALLNAVLEKGKTAFAGVNADTKEATNTLQQLKVAISEIMEVIALAFNRTFGPAVKSALAGIRDFANEFKDSLKVKVGEPAEAAAANIRLIQAEITRLQGINTGFQKSAESYDNKGFFGKLFGVSPEMAQAESDRISAMITEKQKQIEELKKTAGSAGSSGNSSGAVSSGGVNSVNHDKELQEEAKFQGDLLQLKKARLDSEAVLAQNSAETERVLGEQAVLIAEQGQQQIDVINANATLSFQQKEQLKLQVAQDTNLKLEQSDQDLNSKRMAALDQYGQHATSVFDGIGKAFKSGAAKNELQLKQFGDFGKITFNSFSTHAVSALEDIGAGTKSAGDIIKGFFFGMLGDMAEQYGQFMLLRSIWPPDPVGLAGGAAMLVLAGYLKSQAGGSSSGGSSSASASASAAAPSSPTFSTPTTADNGVAAAAQQKKAVSINIAGSYFETEQTKTRLVEMIREATDATDFSIKQVGSFS